MSDHNSYVVGAGAGATLESGLSQPTNTITDPKVLTITSHHSTGGANFYNGNTGVETSSEFGSHQAADGAKIFSASGAPKATIDKPSDLVTYQGMPVQAVTLEKMGVLKLNSQGRYDFVEQSPTPEQQEQQQASSDLHDSFSMSDSENNEINSIIPEGIDGGCFRQSLAEGLMGLQQVTGLTQLMHWHSQRVKPLRMHLRKLGRYLRRSQTLQIVT